MVARAILIMLFAIATASTTDMFQPNAITGAALVALIAHVLNITCTNAQSGALSLIKDITIEVVGVLITCFGLHRLLRAYTAETATNEDLVNLALHLSVGL